MEKNVTEKLFDGTAKEFDSKHKLNTSKEIISESIIEDIEKNGITSEMLDRLKLPVYRYRTQVTIHGIFPKGADVRVGGYKNLVKNGNGSLGVRYTAIDRAKKTELFQLTRFATPNFWSIEDSSTQFSIFHQEPINNQEQYATLRDRAQLINKELKKCTFGHVDAYIAKTIFGLYGIINVHISAFYEKDMEDVFKALNPDTTLTLEEARRGLAEETERKRIEDAKRRAKLNEEYERDRAEREAKKAAQRVELQAKVEKYAAENGFVFHETFDLHNKTVQVMAIESGWADYKIYYRRYEGKNKMTKIIPCYSNWEENITCCGRRSTKNMTLYNVWVKHV